VEVGEKCPVCHHQEKRIIDRFLALPAGTPGKRGARSLAKPMGLDRRDLARHERECLATVDEGGGGNGRSHSLRRYQARRR
jgi:hypothetical protein